MNAIKAEALRLRIEAERKAAQTPMLGAVTSGAQAVYLCNLLLNGGMDKDTEQSLRKAIGAQSLRPSAGVSAAEKAAVLGDGWIAHDGGPCPVSHGVRIEVRYRDPDYSGIQTGERDPTHPENHAFWTTSSGVGITHYRLAKPAQAEPAAITPDVLRAAFVNAGVTEAQLLSHTGKWHEPEEVGEFSFSFGNNAYRPGPSTPPDVLARFYRQWDALEVHGMRVEGHERLGFTAGAKSYSLPPDARLIRPL